MVNYTYVCNSWRVDGLFSRLGVYAERDCFIEVTKRIHTDCSSILTDEKERVEGEKLTGVDFDAS